MDEIVKRLLRIKTIGWTSVIIFGIAALWILFEIVALVVFVNSVDSVVGRFYEAAKTVQSAVGEVRFALFLAAALMVLATIGAVGLIRLRKWGLVLYQSSTLVMTVFLLAILIYYLFVVREEIDDRMITPLPTEPAENLRAVMRWMSFACALFLLLASWLLVRTNIFLGRRSSRMEFR